MMILFISDFPPSFPNFQEILNKSLSQANDRLSHVTSRDDLRADFHAREVAAAALKRAQAVDWLPEYRPVSIVPPGRSADTVLERVTRISPALILGVGMTSAKIDRWRFSFRVPKWLFQSCLPCSVP